MATIEKTGLFTYIDEHGNQYILYPVTQIDAVDGLREALEKMSADMSNELSESIKTVNENKIDRSGALPMAADLAMGNHKVTNLAAPENDTDAANKQYVDGKKKTFNVVLTTNDWEGEAAPYKQTIGIAGILGTDRPHYGPVYSEDTTTMLSEKEAWMLVDDLDTADGSVTFTCLEDKPETNVTVQMEVHR